MEAEMHLSGSVGITFFHYLQNTAFPSVTIEIVHIIIFHNQSKAKSDSSKTVRSSLLGFRDFPFLAELPN